MECHFITYPVSRNRHFSQTLALLWNIPCSFLNMLCLTAVINHRRPSVQKRLDKILVLVDVNHLRLLAHLPEKSLKPCSGPLVKNIILVSVCTASSLITLAFTTSFPGYSLYFEKVPWLRLVTCLLDFSRFQ